MLTYALFNIENVLILAQPFFLGWAINDLYYSGSPVGLAVLIGGQLLHLAVRLARQMYDTRVFSGIFRDRVTKLVIRQRGEGTAVSHVSARSHLSRQFVEFFEHQVPVIIESLYFVVGSLVALAFYDVVLAAYCLILIVPSLILNRRFGRQTLQISRSMHDIMEHEIHVLERADGDEVRKHYRSLADNQVRLSDREAFTVGVMELFVVTVVALSLVHYCRRGVNPGNILAVLRYVMMFVMALDRVPMLVERLSRLRDIGRRMDVDGPAQRPARPATTSRSRAESGGGGYS